MTYSFCSFPLFLFLLIFALSIMKTKKDETETEKSSQESDDWGNYFCDNLKSANIVWKLNRDLIFDLSHCAIVIVQRCVNIWMAIASWIEILDEHVDRWVSKVIDFLNPQKVDQNSFVIKFKERQFVMINPPCVNLTKHFHRRGVIAIYHPPLTSNLIQNRFRKKPP